MATFAPQALLKVRCQIRIQPVRYRLINIQKPWPSHFRRAKVEKMCKPVLPRSLLFDPDVPQYEKCKVTIKYFAKPEVDNPYENLLAKDGLNWFNKSKLIAFLHRNSTTGYEQFDIRLLMKKNNMEYREVGKQLMQKTVAGTQYEVANCLFVSHSSIICSEEPQVALLLKLLKKTPKYALMAGIVEGRFLSRSELESYASLPDLQNARAALVGVLNSAAASVVQNINHHQTTLVQQLQQHIELSQQSSEQKSSTDET